MTTAIEQLKRLAVTFREKVDEDRAREYLRSWSELDPDALERAVTKYIDEGDPDNPNYNGFPRAATIRKMARRLGVASPGYYDSERSGLSLVLREQIEEDRRKMFIRSLPTFEFNHIRLRYFETGEYDRKACMQIVASLRSKGSYMYARSIYQKIKALDEEIRQWELSA